MLRLGTYNADYAALLPLFLQRRRAASTAPLAAQFLFLQRSYESIAIGMHNSVVCAEDVPFWPPEALARARATDTFMGTGQLEALTTLCRIWPRGPIDADLHQPPAQRRAGAPALRLG